MSFGAAETHTDSIAVYCLQACTRQSSCFQGVAGYVSAKVLMILAFPLGEECKGEYVMAFDGTCYDDVIETGRVGHR